MGWFTNKDKHDKEEVHVQTRRSCQSDPQDEHFMICTNNTTETQIINGKKHTETKTTTERVPVQTSSFLPTSNLVGIDSEFQNMVEQSFNQIFNNFGNAHGFLKLEPMEQDPE